MEQIRNIERFAVQAGAARLGSHLKEGIAMLLQKVEKFLRENDMAATKFGRLAAGDPRFVLDLRMGRIPRPATVERTLEWMAQYRSSVASQNAPAHSTFQTKALFHAV